jgi:hypothetical protein
MIHNTLHGFIMCQQRVARVPSSTHTRMEFDTVFIPVEALRITAIPSRWWTAIERDHSLLGDVRRVQTLCEVLARSDRRVALWSLLRPCEGVNGPQSNGWLLHSPSARKRIDYLVRIRGTELE